MKQPKVKSTSRAGLKSSDNRPIVTAGKWVATAALVPILAYFLHAYWIRPQLTISIARALVGTDRSQTSDIVYEHRAVVDLQAPCVAWLVEHYASARTMPVPRAPRIPRLVYGVYLQNEGRSEVTDIRLAFRGGREDVTITSSPQLSISQEQITAPDGGHIRIVSVAAMAPGAKGVIFGVRPLPGATVVARTSRTPHTVEYVPSNTTENPLVTGDVQFVGSGQLSDAPLHLALLDDLLRWQKETFGLYGLTLPIDPVEVSADGGEVSMITHRTTSESCASSKSCECYAVRIVRRGREHIGADTSAIAKP